MSPGAVDLRVALAKLEIVEKMLAAIASLPLSGLDTFVRDPRMVAAGESYLRRSLEALLDLGRHILAKAFGRPVSEYGEIGDALGVEGVLSQEDAELLRRMAGYRNRLVHLYHEVDDTELYRILTQHLADIARVAGSLRSWLNDHPERVTGAPR